MGKLVPSVWMALGNPSIEKMQAIFPVLPQQLLQPCFPTAEAMCMYMDPALAPPTRSGKPPLPPAHTRIIEPSQQAGCVMAAYHYQHLLPPSLLQRKGLLGFFVSSPQGVRFLSSPEVASLHGACDLVLIPRDDREAIRILGNSLSVQQATAAFVLAMQPFAEFCSCPSPADAVQLCHTHRLHASNSLLVEIDQGWLLCHQRHVGRTMQRLNIRTQVSSRLLDSSHEFLPLQIVAGHGKSEVRIVFYVSSHLKLPEALRYLNLRPHAKTGDFAAGTCRVVCTRPLAIPLIQSTRAARADEACIHLLIRGTHFLVRRDCVDVFHQIAQAIHQVPATSQACVKYYDGAGTQLHNIVEFPRMVLITPNLEDFLLDCPSIPAGAFHDSQAVDVDEAITWSVPSQHAGDWWISFPLHLVAAIGWAFHCSSFPPPEETEFLLNVHPVCAAGPFSAFKVRGWMRMLLTLAQARAVEVPLTHPSSCRAELQIVAKTILTGCLPKDLQLDDVHGWWRNASHVLALDPAGRVYSGPFPQAPDVRLGELRSTDGVKALVRRTTGVPVITLMPAIYGGGAKDEKAQLVQSQTAQACLEHGWSLQDANRVTGRLVQQLGATRMQQAIDGPSMAQRFSQLQALMQANGIPPPSEADIDARTARRIKQQSKKKQWFDSPPTSHLRVASFTTKMGVRRPYCRP